MFREIWDDNHPAEREHERSANDQSEQFIQRHIPFDL